MVSIGSVGRNGVGSVGCRVYVGFVLLGYLLFSHLEKWIVVLFFPDGGKYSSGTIVDVAPAAVLKEVATPEKKTSTGVDFLLRETGRLVASL